MSEQHGEWQGTNGFRMYPTDEMSVARSTARTTTVADGHGWTLTYTWIHPTDGEQTGTLLLGTPEEDGSASLAWMDSWHQKPGVRLFTGTGDENGVDTQADYDGWGWTIAVTAEPDALTLTMCNVVPADHPSGQPGPYEVMQARWWRAR